MKTQYWLDSRPIDDRKSCGDFAECFPLDHERFAIIIGDVAGRGAPAGSAASALLHLARIAVTSREPLRTSLALVDDIFGRDIKCEEVALATLFLAVVDLKDRVVDYTSAGHEPPLHFPIRSCHDHLSPTGPLLGLGKGPSISFEQRRFHLAPESVLVAVTDGITESRRYESGSPLFFGSHGVARAFASARPNDDPAQTIADAAVAHASGWKRDDATVLVIEMGQASPPMLSSRSHLKNEVKRLTPNLEGD